MKSEGKAHVNPSMETFSWMLNRWESKIQPRFEKFIALLKDRSSEIPEHYFDSTSHYGNGTNPIFRFLRPKSAIAIWTAVNDPKYPKEAEKILASVVCPFVIYWRMLLQETGKYHKDKKQIAIAKNKFNVLCNRSQLYGGDHDTILNYLRNKNQQRKDIDPESYLGAYNDFCTAFLLLQTAEEEDSSPATDETAATIASAVVKKLKAASGGVTKRARGTITQTVVAKFCGVSVMTIKRWENGPNAKDDPSTKSNPWGYYKSLRLNKDLWPALKTVCSQIRKHTDELKKCKALSKKTGHRVRTKGTTFYTFKDDWGGEHPHTDPYGEDSCEV